MPFRRTFVADAAISVDSNLKGWIQYSNKCAFSLESTVFWWRAMSYSLSRLLKDQGLVRLFSRSVAGLNYGGDDARWMRRNYVFVQFTSSSYSTGVDPNLVFCIFRSVADVRSCLAEKLAQEVLHS